MNSQLYNHKPVILSTHSICVSSASCNKQPLFPCTTFTAWSSQRKPTVFFVRYEMNLHISYTKMYTCNCKHCCVCLLLSYVHIMYTGHTHQDIRHKTAPFSYRGRSSAVSSQQEGGGDRRQKTDRDLAADWRSGIALLFKVTVISRES
jgi:hypothetical protein